MSFSAANRRDLNDDPDPADRIAVQLAGRYPEKRRIRFLSDELVPCRQDPDQNAPYDQVWRYLVNANFL